MRVIIKTCSIDLEVGYSLLSISLMVISIMCLFSLSVSDVYALTFHNVEPAADSISESLQKISHVSDRIDNKDNWKCLELNRSLDLSNSSLVSTPRLSALDNNVFVVWEEGRAAGKSNIVYRHSNDSGITFGPATFISSDDDRKDGAAAAVSITSSSSSIDVTNITGGGAELYGNTTSQDDSATQPDIASSADNVYILWKSLQSGIQLKHSNDSGITFGPATTLTTNDTSTVSDLKVAASGDNVYILWKSLQSGIQLKHSNDSGITFYSFPLKENSNSSLVSTPRLSASDNNVFVVWEEGRAAGKSNIVYRHSNDSGITFGPATNLNYLLGLNSILYQPELYSYGNSIVFIKMNSVEKGVLLFKSNDSGITFGPATTLTNDTGISDLKVAASGDNVYILWKNSSIANNNIFFDRFDGELEKVAGKAMLSDNIGLPVSPASISASENNVFVVWEEGRAGKSNIVYRHSNDSGITFGPATFISSDDDRKDGAASASITNNSNDRNGDTAKVKTEEEEKYGNKIINSQDDSATQPDIASSADNVYIVWKSFQSGIQLKHSNDSGITFGPATTLTTNDTSTVSDLKVAASGDNVYILWKSLQSGIQLKHSNDSGITFGPATTLTTNDTSTEISDLKVAASGDNVYMVWKDTINGKPNIFYKKSPTNARTFDPVLRLTEGNTTGYGPDIQAIEKGGHVYAAWNSPFTGIGFAFSEDGGITFENFGNISLVEAGVSDLKVAASEDNVYIVWKQNGEFVYVKLHKSEPSFSGPIKFSEYLGDRLNLWGANSIEIDAQNNQLHSVWVQPLYIASEADTSYHEIYYARLNTNSLTDSCSQKIDMMDIDSNQ